MTEAQTDDLKPEEYHDIISTAGRTIAVALQQMIQSRLTLGVERGVKKFREMYPLCVVEPERIEALMRRNICDHLAYLNAEAAMGWDERLFALAMAASTEPEPEENQGPPQALVVEPDGAMYRLYSLDYEAISGAVGGFIQLAPASNFPGKVTLYINEEGKRLGMEHNPYATQIVGTDNLLPGDHIVGPMWIGGPVNDEGEETPLSEETLTEISNFVIEHGGRWG